MNFLLWAAAILVIIGIASVAAMLVVRNVIHICEPNEVLIFSGGSSVAADGHKRGFRIIKGGRGYRVPLIEAVDRLDLTNMVIDVAVSNAYSKGGIPLTVQGVANVKVAGHDPALSNAIERFLGKDRRMIVRIAKDTLEGNLRGVLSQLTPEEVNDDKIAFAEKLLDEAEHDLGKLGLTLDTLKVQNVSDDVKYLDSIGRKQSAEVIKRARIAEANAHAQSAQREASNLLKSETAKIASDTNVTKAEVAKRIRDAETRMSAVVAEERGKVLARIAAAEADLKVQEAQVKQIQLKLLADVVAPAQAEMEAKQAQAKGDSAKIIEDGKATVAVLDVMIKTWKAGGENARDIFLMQKLKTLMTSMVATIDKVDIDKVTVLPRGSGSDATSAKAVRLVEELKGALGIDLPRLLEQAASRSGQPLLENTD
ncbi:MAG: flotillin family protein [Oligoflexia bacterium]|nr:flotillin family protein [Oligoflexia bacterium]